MYSGNWKDLLQMHPRLSWKSINTGLFTILSVFVLATITSIVFLSYTLFKLDSLTAKSAESVSTTLKLNNLLIDLTEAESAARGYIITGGENFLVTYEKAVDNVPGHLKDIQSGGGIEISQAQSQKLVQLSNQRVTALEAAIALRTTGNDQALRDYIANGSGSAMMQDLRTEANSISERSLKDIEDRQGKSHGSLQRALTVAGLLSVFIMGICAVLAWYFQRTIMHERALEGTKSEFLSMASHQLRTPATNVKQYIGMLLDGYLGDLTEKQQDALRIAYKNNETEIHIMNDLLDVAKLDLKRIQIHKQRANVVTIVQQVIKGYKPHIVEHNLTVKLKAPPELYAMVDRTYFKGVIDNLFDNAMRYSRDNTRIIIRITADEQSNTFVVTVRDQGFGIKKREVPKLFMKFSRLNNEFSAKSEGSGLGLYWVKQVMALHGGSISVISKEGRGSKFIVRAPIN